MPTVDPLETHCPLNAGRTPALANPVEVLLTLPTFQRVRQVDIALIGYRVPEVDVASSYMSATPTAYERTCPYCEIKHTPPPHWSEGNYCSREHRLACDEKKSVAFVERECELKEELLSDEFDAGKFYDQVEGIVHDAAPLVAELPDDLTEKFCGFFAGWLALPGCTRDAAAMRLSGVPAGEVAKRLGVSNQAISKNLRKGAVYFAPIRAVIRDVPTSPRSSKKAATTNDGNGASNEEKLQLQHVDSQ